MVRERRDGEKECVERRKKKVSWLVQLGDEREVFMRRGRLHNGRSNA